jgi:hypothetical protein
MKPILERKISNESNIKLVSGQEFFEFFEQKRLKLILAFFAGIVGVLGNFHSVRFQLVNTRLDFQNPDLIDLYAFGLTGLLDIMIVLFHLMRIKILVIVSTFSAIFISLLANFTVLNTDNNSSLEIIVGLIMSALPIVILTYLTHLVINQFDLELKIAREN